MQRLHVVFGRSLSDDSEYFEERIQKSELHLSYTQAILDQLRAEIDSNPEFAGRFQFSDAVTILDDMYYCLGEIEVEAMLSQELTVNAFVEKFQVCYDEYGMAGHFHIGPHDQPEVVPPWIIRQRLAPVTH